MAAVYLSFSARIGRFLQNILTKL